MKAYLFPSQGSQAKGMGAGLFEQYPHIVAQADSILGYSIREICLNDPRGELNKTQFTQPALYVVNALSYFHQLDSSGVPDFFAGHSLGEFNALMAAGCFDFETGLHLVKKRGELMAGSSGGAMAAILNASSEHIAEVLKVNGLHNVYMANYNTPLQTVISGLRSEVMEASKYFQMQGKMRFYPLVTSGAFHSPYMQRAMEEFRVFLQDVELRPAAIPVIANVTARPYIPMQMLDTLARQMISTVRWSDSMQYLLALARSEDSNVEFVECGHGDVLKRMAEMVKLQTAPEELDRVSAELKMGLPA